MRVAGATAIVCLFGCAADDEADGADAGAGGSAVGGSGGDGTGGDGSGGTLEGGAGGSGGDLGGSGGDLGGSGGDIGGTGGGLGGAGGTGGAEPPPAPSVEEVQAILDANCDGCHIGGGQSGGMALDDVNDQVGTPSNEAAGFNRITPGDHENSYLWQKINGGAATLGGTDTRMPLGGQLTDEEIALIGSWIDSL
jgi:hypothetical protein